MKKQKQTQTQRAEMQRALHALQRHNWDTQRQLHQATLNHTAPEIFEASLHQVVAPVLNQAVLHQAVLNHQAIEVAEAVIVAQGSSWVHNPYSATNPITYLTGRGNR